MDITGLPSGTVYPALATAGGNRSGHVQVGERRHRAARAASGAQVLRVTPAGKEALAEALKRYRLLSRRRAPLRANRNLRVSKDELMLTAKRHMKRRVRPHLLADRPDRRDRPATVARRLATGSGKPNCIAAKRCSRIGRSSTSKPNSTCFGGVSALSGMRSGYSKLRWEDEMFQDLRYGARMLLKRSSLTATAVLTLALGSARTQRSSASSMGSCCIPCLTPQPERLVRVWGTNRQAGNMRGQASISQSSGLAHAKCDL